MLCTVHAAALLAGSKLLNPLNQVISSFPQWAVCRNARARAQLKVPRGNSRFRGVYEMTPGWFRAMIGSERPSSCAWSGATQAF